MNQTEHNSSTISKNNNEQAESEALQEACCRHKKTPHDEKEKKQLQNRLNRIIGQLNGIKNMVDDNRYCGDILIQIAAAESALQSLGYLIFKGHMETCVVDEIQHGNLQAVEEAIELMKKLK